MPWRVVKHSLKTSLGPEITDGLTASRRFVFERSSNTRQRIFRTDRRSGNHANVFGCHVADYRLAVVAKPIFDSGIYDLKTGAVPAVAKNKIACAFELSLTLH